MPIGITGTALAFITLSNSWLRNGFDFVKPMAVFVAVCMLILTALRAILYPGNMWAELKHPVTGTFYPPSGWQPGWSPVTFIHMRPGCAPVCG